MARIEACKLHNGKQGSLYSFAEDVAILLDLDMSIYGPSRALQRSLRSMQSGSRLSTQADTSPYTLRYNLVLV